MVYFHGNAEDLGHQRELLEAFVGAFEGVEVLAVEYPGYGIYERKYCTPKNIMEDGY